MVDIIDKEFKPLGFKRKGNHWEMIGPAVRKIIQLLKSSFSKLYYINYGFNFINLKYDAVSMHIFQSLGSADDNENQLIKGLLDFENDIDIETRKSGLAEVISNNLKGEPNKINSETDAIAQIKERPILLNALP